MSAMKCKELVITSNGTTVGTKILVDGKQIGLVQRIELTADISDKFVKLQVYTAAKDAQGKVKSKTVKVRDSATQKFVEQYVPVYAPIIVEFVA
jgi:hypothetical protein